MIDFRWKPAECVEHLACHHNRHTDPFSQKLNRGKHTSVMSIVPYNKLAKIILCGSKPSTKRKHQHGPLLISEVQAGVFRPAENARSCFPEAAGQSRLGQRIPRI